METVQVVLDKELLDATNRAAKRMKKNRSALVRDALEAYLRNLDLRLKEQQECAAYERQPQNIEEALYWESAAAWPAE